MVTIRLKSQTGTVLIGLLVLVALLGLGLVGAAQWLRSVEQHEKERELIFVGHQFRNAIDSYRKSGGSANQYPRKLEDLLLDTRRPTVLRHLRRVYADPLTGKTVWGLVKAPDGGILGVFSLSTSEPMKRQGFASEDKDIEQAILLKQEKKINPSTVQLQTVESTNTLAMKPLAGMLQTSSVEDADQPLTPDPAGYSYRDWKFVVQPNVIGTSGGRNGGGG